MNVKLTAFFILSAFLVFSSCRRTISDADLQHQLAAVKEIAGKMNSDFRKLKEEVINLSGIIKHHYEAQDSILPHIDKSKYGLSGSGVFYKKANDGGSAVFVSGVCPVDEKVKRIVYFTEPIETEFKALVHKYPEAAQVYYNDEHSYNRIYPFFDVLTQYEPKMKIPDFNFYYLADAAHNPERRAVWVKEPYVDPAGRGWMISVISPCYYSGRLVGVPGIDITTNTITDRYLTQTRNANLLIIDSTGVIVSAQEHVINLLSFPALKDHKYIETIKLDTYRRESYNLFLCKEQATRAIAEKIISKGEYMFDQKIANNDYYVVAAYIPEVSWYVIELISRYAKD